MDLPTKRELARIIWELDRIATLMQVHRSSVEEHRDSCIILSDQLRMHKDALLKLAGFDVRP